MVVKWLDCLFLINACCTLIGLEGAQIGVNVDLKDIISSPINADKLLDVICPDKLVASGRAYNGKKFYFVGIGEPEQAKAISLQKATISSLENYIEANLKVDITAMSSTMIDLIAAAKSNNGIYSERIIFDKIGSNKIGKIECCFLADSKGSNNGPIIQHCKRSDKIDDIKETQEENGNINPEEDIFVKVFSNGKEQLVNPKSENHSCDRYNSVHSHQDTPSVNCNFNCNCNCNCNTCSKEGNNKDFKATTDQQETIPPADSYSYSASKSVPVNPNKNVVDNNTPKIVNCNFNCNCNCNCNNCKTIVTAPTIPFEKPTMQTTTKTDTSSTNIPTKLKVVSSKRSTSKTRRSPTTTINVTTKISYSRPRRSKITNLFTITKTTPQATQSTIPIMTTDRTHFSTSTQSAHKLYNPANSTSPKSTSLFWLTSKLSTPHFTTKSKYYIHYLQPNSRWYSTTLMSPKQSNLTTLKPSSFISTRVLHSTGRRSTNVTSNIYHPIHTNNTASSSPTISPYPSKDSKSLSSPIPSTTPFSSVFSQSSTLPVPSATSSHPLIPMPSSISTHSITYHPVIQYSSAPLTTHTSHKPITAPSPFRTQSFTPSYPDISSTPSSHTFPFIPTPPS